MYFETGQGSALSAGAHHGVDQQTVEVRACAVARAFSPFLVNTVVGFIGPEYLYGAGCRGLPLRHHRAGGRRRHVGVPEPVLPRRPPRPRRTGAPAGARVRGVARPDRPARRAWSRARRLARPLPSPRARDRRTAMTSSLDPWPALRSLTPARISLGRSGHALPTAAVLAFAADHAAARDAVHDELDT